MTAPVPVRQAATVVVLRDSPDGLETWLLRRVPKMAFAAGMSVFPGGSVDPADERPHRVSQPALTEQHLRRAAEQFATSEAHVRTLATAAVRETFEEVGALLSTPPVLVPDAVRAAVEAGESSLDAVLTDLDTALDLTAVHPWARWITPEGEARRYDTYFFVAVLPAGSTAASVTSEASHADWVPIATALTEYDRGLRPMLPPTVHTLRSIAEHRDAASVVAAAARRVISAISPSLGRDPDGKLVAVLPDGTRFHVGADVPGLGGGS